VRGALTQTDVDALMKFVYRGMAEPSAEFSQSLLNWHAAIVEVAGVGPIVRAMTDRTPFRDAEAARNLRGEIGTLQGQVADAKSRLHDDSELQAQLAAKQGTLATLNPWEGPSDQSVNEGLQGRMLFRKDVLAWRGY
jgi:hypothetical protein